jgi:aspartate dehydrogenase
VIASGAIAALDGLASARLVGLSSVTYRQRPPVTSWRGHPLAPLETETPGVHAVFRGTAREAARLFPKNANVTAAIALAGVGLDSTRVELLSEMSAARNPHEIHAGGAFGTLRLRQQAASHCTSRL